MEKGKPLVIVMGPVKGRGGIATVIDLVISQKILLDYYDIIPINTSHYKNSKLKDKLITFLLGFCSLIFTIIFQSPKIIHLHTSHCYSFYRKSIFGFVGKLFKIKIVYHIHASDFYNFFCEPKNINIRRFINLTFSQADKIVCLCFDWANRLQEKFNLTNVNVITNPVAQNQICYPNKCRNNITKILFLGSYVHRKGIEDMLEVFKQIVAIRKDIHFNICGAGELNEYIDQFIKIHQLSEYIKNIGWVSGEKKDMIFKDSDIFILPSYKEGLPITILEAFSFGLPVISTKISGIPEIITNYINGFIIEPGNRKVLFQKIIELSDNHKLTEYMSKNNIEYIKSHFPDIIASKWLSLYDELILDKSG